MLHFTAEMIRLMIFTHVLILLKFVFFSPHLQLNFHTKMLFGYDGSCVCVCVCVCVCSSML